MPGVARVDHRIKWEVSPAIDSAGPAPPNMMRFWNTASKQAGRHIPSERTPTKIPPRNGPQRKYHPIVVVTKKQTKNWPKRKCPHCIATAHRRLATHTQTKSASFAFLYIDFSITPPIYALASQAVSILLTLQLTFCTLLISPIHSPCIELP
jgi:hypothetical protein